MKELTRQLHNKTILKQGAIQRWAKDLTYGRPSGATEKSIQQTLIGYHVKSPATHIKIKQIQLSPQEVVRDKYTRNQKQ